MASGDGGPDVKGAVALLNIFMCGEFLPVKDEVGDEFSSSVEPPLEEKGGLGGGISLSGTTLLASSITIDSTNSGAMGTGASH